MRKILFVGGIPAVLTEVDIDLYFSKHCKVIKVRVMREKKTLESKGFAFVTLADASSAHLMLQKVHIIHGRKVDVQLASRKGEKKDWKDEQKKKRIFVSNLPVELENVELARCFSKYGEVRNAYIIKDFLTDQSKNYGYIEFNDMGVVQSVLNDQVIIRSHKVLCLPYVGRHEPRTNKQNFENPEELSEDVIYTKKVQPKTSEYTEALLGKGYHCSPQSTNIQQFSNNSKYEYLGISSRLCQDESNYSFRFKSGVSRGSAKRLPANSNRVQVSLENTELATYNSIVRFKMLKALKNQKSQGSPEQKTAVSPGETTASNYTTILKTVESNSKIQSSNYCRFYF